MRERFGNPKKVLHFVDVDGVEEEVEFSLFSWFSEIFAFLRLAFEELFFSTAFGEETGGWAFGGWAFRGEEVVVSVLLFLEMWGKFDFLEFLSEFLGEFGREFDGEWGVGEFVGDDGADFCLMEVEILFFCLDFDFFAIFYSSFLCVDNSVGRCR